MKTLLSISHAPPRHWVGNGFPVHGLFGYSGDTARRSPFLLLDYAAPTTFTPTEERRGVGAHPHRGFETVTIVYAGEVEHRDSAGNGGVIGPGAVQWMTAGRGLLHEEFHSTRYARAGGPFEMVQLWVNLPARDKLTTPGYQAIGDAAIPAVALPGDAGQVRVIAGRHGGHKGPARTHTPMHVLDVRLRAGHAAVLDQPDGWNTLLVVLAGHVSVNDGASLGPAQVATFSASGSTLVVQAREDSTLLLLAGEPIDEPVVGHGPFVMNTEAEIREAMRDFGAGRFGRM
jgi:redox-sensitive bicupin YhaK (pirin superfamily)